jgi:hypothetical protein
MGPCGENVLKIYFSGTTEPFEKNLCWNIPSGVFYNMYVFVLSWIPRWATTT